MGKVPKGSVLTTKDGQYVIVQLGKDGLILCADDRQDAPSVYIHTRVRRQRNQVALCFTRDDGHYFPKVDGKLMVDKTTAKQLTESHWFEKTNLQDGEYYSLRSVGQTTKCLSMSTDAKGRKIFCLGGSNEACVLTDRAKA